MRDGIGDFHTSNQGRWRPGRAPHALLLIAALTVGWFWTPAVHAGSITVDLELSLLVDVSISVSGPDFILQRDGYANAFRSAAVQSGIAGLPNGIAVNLIYYSGATQQVEAVAWTHLTGAASANAFANAIQATARPFSGNTAPGSAINFATPLFASNDFDGLRQVMDVSGDGEANDGADTLAARNAALAAGIDTINGLVITTDPSVVSFYQNNVVGGTNAFLAVVGNFTEFGPAVEQKLQVEITGVVPEPTSLTLVGVGAFSAVGYAWRRRRQLATC